MKTFKKILALMLCVITVLSFVSCGGDDKEEVPTLIWYDRSATTPDHEEVTKAINEYIEPLIGCKVKRISIVGSEYGQKMQLILAANEQADIIYTGGSTLHSYVKNGSFISITSVPIYAPGGEFVCCKIWGNGLYYTGF